LGEDSLKDFTINWILTGFLTFCLLAFATTFMYNNNPGGFGDTDSVFSSSYNNFSSQLMTSSESSDALLNITANTNPEVSDLGSRDSVATSYEAKSSATGYWESSKILMSWVFSGHTGKMLISVFAGILALLSYFYIMKHIRTGT